MVHSKLTITPVKAGDYVIRTIVHSELLDAPKIPVVGVEVGPRPNTIPHTIHALKLKVTDENGR